MESQLVTWLALLVSCGQEESDSAVQGRYPGVAPSRALGSHFSSSVANMMEGRGQGQIHLNKAQLSPEGLTDLIPRVLPCYSDGRLLQRLSRRGQTSFCGI